MYRVHRVDGCVFDIAVFTNFSEDHISEKEHPDMEDYFNSKLKLFHMCKTGYVNADDLHTAKIPKMLPDNDISTYGIDNYCNLLAKDITITNSYLPCLGHLMKTGFSAGFSIPLIAGKSFAVSFASFVISFGS